MQASLSQDLHFYNIDNVWQYFFFFHNCIYVLTIFNLVLSSYLSSTDI